MLDCVDNHTGLSMIR